MKRILVATDGSDGALRAVAAAAGLAKDYGADLVIAHVTGGYDFPGEVFQQMSRPQNVWLREALDADAARVLDAARKAAAEHGAGTIEVVSRTGDPVETILALADERDADAIVVGKRGLGRVGGLLLGSISQKIISLAKRLVVVVP